MSAENPIAAVDWYVACLLDRIAGKRVTGLGEAKEGYQRATAELARDRHRIECADTPLMRDVMGERDRYRTALTTISDADNPDAPISRETCARVARDAVQGVPA